ncbi:hypothetical protein [Xanthomonas sp. NCPPB 2632]|uniref:DUF7336 domain-containing protein n=1 Tax=Xanthomonas sp. NCPPB 2632 TaxID=3240912 RepID=UPI0035146575
MEKLFLVKHTRKLYADIFSSWFIGWYSTYAKAEAAIERARPLPGFCDFPDDFFIWAIDLDEVHDENADESSARSTRTSDAKIVFQLVWFQELDHEVTDIVFIGVFSSQERAVEAIEKVKGRERFVHRPEGFYVSDVEVDIDHSTSGFFIPDE